MSTAEMNLQARAALTVGINSNESVDSELTALIPKDDPEDTERSISGEEQRPSAMTCSQIIGGSIGNVLEWYDFASFGLLASEIGYNFFPSNSSDEVLSLLKAYGVFAGAFIMRPVGGVIFGMLGDKTGRKRALQISMILMFASTFLMGCLPTMDVIGIGAPIALTTLRLAQGVSVGGQLVGSILFMIESADPERRGFWGSIALATAVLGDTAASLVVSLLKTWLSTEEMRSWGWRVPFLSSMLVAVFGIVYQHKMPPSRDYELAMRESQMTGNPVKNAVQRHWRMILLMLFALVPWCAGNYVTFTFLPIYLQSALDVDHALLTSSLLLVWKMVMLVVGGTLADRYGYFAIMKVGVAVLCLLSWPSYFLLEYMYIDRGEAGVWPLVVSDFVTVIGLGLLGGPMQLFMVDSIEDVVLRYSAIGIAYNLCQAIFGGTAPLVGSALTMANLVYVGVYLSACSALSFGILWFLHRDARWNMKLCTKF